MTSVPSKHVAVPKYPLIIHTPAPFRPPSHTALVILDKVARGLIISAQVWTITYSPVLCPLGKNWLFTLKPYYWENDGVWADVPDRRDGQRNPYSDVPQGQKQLESMSLTIRNLSLAAQYSHTLADQARKRAEEVLRVFFVDEETRMNPEVRYAQCVMGDNPLKGDSCFVIACRSLLLVSQSIPGLSVSSELEQDLRDWFTRHVEWMQTSEQGAEARTRNNNITVWYYALIASHLAYLHPSKALTEAYSFFTSLASKHPTPASYLQNELRRTRPRHYVLFTLEPTFILAALTSPPSSTPPLDVMQYLQILLDFARTLQPGELEKEADNDTRYDIKLRWFEKMFARWRGEEVDEKLDGTAWEGGWNSNMKISWDCI